MKIANITKFEHLWNSGKFDFPISDVIKVRRGCFADETAKSRSRVRACVLGVHVHHGLANDVSETDEL